MAYFPALPPVPQETSRLNDYHCTCVIPFETVSMYFFILPHQLEFFFIILQAQSSLVYPALPGMKLYSPTNRNSFQKTITLTISRSGIPYLNVKCLVLCL